MKYNYNVWNVKPLFTQPKKKKTKKSSQPCGFVKPFTFQLGTKPVKLQSRKDFPIVLPSMIKPFSLPSTVPTKVRPIRMRLHLDTDRDGVPDYLDCDPFDPFKHAVPPEHADKKLTFHDRGTMTFAEIFREAEERVVKQSEGKYRKRETDTPVGTHLFKDPEWEKELSDRLAKYLLRRKDRTDIDKLPIKHILGVHELDVNIGESTVRYIQDVLKHYLERMEPGLTFEFYDVEDEALMVKVIDYRITQKMLNNIAMGDKKLRCVKCDGDGIYQNEKCNACEGKGERLYKKPYKELLGKEKRVVREEAKEQMREGIDRGVSKVTKYLKHAPDYITDLLTFIPSPRATVWITDCPIELIMKSTGRGWEGISCERLTSGDSCIAGPFSDIEHGNAIAFLYAGDKTPKKDPPSGRVMVRWGINQKGELDVGFERVVYGFDKRAVIQSDILVGMTKLFNSLGFFKSTVETPYIYEGYSDVEGKTGTQIRMKPYTEREHKGKYYTGPREHIKTMFEYTPRGELHPTLLRSTIPLAESDIEIQRIVAGSKEIAAHQDVITNWLTGPYSLEIKKMLAGIRPLPSRIMEMLFHSDELREFFFEAGDIPDDFWWEPLRVALDKRDAKTLKQVVSKGPELSREVIGKIMLMGDAELVAELISRYGSDNRKLQGHVGKVKLNKLLDVIDDSSYILELLNVGLPVTNKLLDYISNHMDDDNISRIVLSNNEVLVKSLFERLSLEAKESVVSSVVSGNITELSDGIMSLLVTYGDDDAREDIASETGSPQILYEIIQISNNEDVLKEVIDRSGDFEPDQFTQLVNWIMEKRDIPHNVLVKVASLPSSFIEVKTRSRSFGESPSIIRKLFSYIRTHPDESNVLLALAENHSIQKRENLEELASLIIEDKKHTGLLRLLQNHHLNVELKKGLTEFYDEVTK